MGPGVKAGVGGRVWGPGPRGLACRAGRARAREGMALTMGIAERFLALGGRQWWFWGLRHAWRWNRPGGWRCGGRALQPGRGGWRRRSAKAGRGAGSPGVDKAGFRGPEELGARGAGGLKGWGAGAVGAVAGCAGGGGPCAGAQGKGLRQGFRQGFRQGLWKCSARARGLQHTSPRRPGACGGSSRGAFEGPRARVPVRVRAAGDSGRRGGLQYPPRPASLGLRGPGSRGELSGTKGAAVTAWQGLWALGRGDVARQRRRALAGAGFAAPGADRERGSWRHSDGSGSVPFWQRSGARAEQAGRGRAWEGAGPVLFLPPARWHLLSCREKLRGGAGGLTDRNATRGPGPGTQRRLMPCSLSRAPVAGANHGGQSLGASWGWPVLGGQCWVASAGLPVPGCL